MREHMYETIFNFLQNEISRIAALLSVIATFGGGVIAFKKYIQKQATLRKKEDIDVSSPNAKIIPKIATISEDIKEENRNHASDVAKRVEFLLKEFSKSHHDLTHSKFARWLGYETAAPLELLLAGKEAPTFQALTDIANPLGVNCDWLIDGNGQPFYLRLPNEGDTRKYIETIKSIEPEILFFVRSKSEYGEVSIVLQVNEYKYMTFNTPLHLSSHVGGTGRHNLWELYKFIRLLRDEYDYGHKLGLEIYGRSLDEEQYDRLVHGHVYPGNIIKEYGPQCHWWDDLTDVNYKHQSGEGKYEGYGKEFVDAQCIIREEIKYREEAGP